MRTHLSGVAIGCMMACMARGANDPNAVFMHVPVPTDQSAAASGNVDANLRMGFRHAYGIGTAQDSAKSLQYFTAAHSAQNSPPSAAAWLGYAMAASPATQSQGSALIEQAAGTGDPVGITFLGYLYKDGIGHPKDLQKAEQLFSQVGPKFALAQGLLGDAYSAETPPRYALAVPAYMTAALMGDSGCALRLGTMYLKGLGVVRDRAKAAQWIARSAESGHQVAIFQRGLLYMRGVGVPKSEHLAAEDFARAANTGFIPAEAQLGWCYANGIGVKKDVNQAIQWLSLAAPKTPAAAALLAKLRGGH